VTWLGAHVSTVGGVARRRLAAPRSAQTHPGVTKTPNQWREPALDPGVIDRFRAELVRHGIARCWRTIATVNLASPDHALRAKSIRTFTGS